MLDFFVKLNHYEFYKVYVTGIQSQEAVKPTSLVYVDCMPVARINSDFESHMNFLKIKHGEDGQQSKLLGSSSDFQGKHEAQNYSILYLFYLSFRSLILCLCNLSWTLTMLRVQKIQFRGHTGLTTLPQVASVKH